MRSWWPGSSPLGWVTGRFVSTKRLAISIIPCNPCCPCSRAALYASCRNPVLHPKVSQKQDSPVRPVQNNWSVI